MLLKFFRYGLVQVSAYGIDFGSFYLVNAAIPDQLVLSNFTGKALAGIYAFVLHKYFTFRSTEKGSEFGEGARFTALLIANYIVSTILLLMFVDFIQDTYAKILADIICVGLSFFIANKLVFKKVSKNKK